MDEGFGLGEVVRRYSIHTVRRLRDIGSGINFGNPPTKIPVDSRLGISQRTHSTGVQSIGQRFNCDIRYIESLMVIEGASAASWDEATVVLEHFNDASKRSWCNIEDQSSSSGGTSNFH